MRGFMILNNLLRQNILSRLETFLLWFVGHNAAFMHFET